MVRSTGTGALILSGFSFLWLNWGLVLLRFPRAGMLRLLFALVCAAVACLAWLLLRGSPVAAGPGEERARIGRQFGWINAAQWAAILVSAVVLSVLNRGEWFPWVVSVIVALHFFPLARLLWRGNAWIGASLLVVDGCSLLLPGTERFGAAAFGSGLVLLGFAAAAVGRMSQIAKQERQRGGIPA